MQHEVCGAYRRETRPWAILAARVVDETNPATSDGLRRELGLLDTIAIVVGACVGVGIFFTPSRVAALAGDPGLALLAWVLGGLVAIAGALTFAEIGAMYPRTGGQYAALRDAYGPGVAFVYVVCNATAIQARGRAWRIEFVNRESAGIGFDT